MAVACLAPPEYSSIPQIEFESLKFIDSKDPNSGDSLILSLNFKDGDGDLGLATEDIGVRNVDDKALYFNNKFYFTLNNQRITWYKEGERLTYAHKRQNPELNLPDYAKPYSCINWEIRKRDDRQDTVYFELNEDHYNIFLSYYIKQNDGSFKLFDWRSEFCTTFNGRFPVLSKDLSKKTPLKGQLHYAMVSYGFKGQFSIKTLKLKVHIQDRLQQKSNEIETPEFQFIE